MLAACSEDPAADLDAGSVDASPGDVGANDSGAGPNDSDAGLGDAAPPFRDAGVFMDGGPIFDGGVEPPFDVLRVGATWTYRTTEVATGMTRDLVTTVEAYEDIGGNRTGEMGYRIRKAKVNGGDSVSWDVDVGNQIIGRIRDQNINSMGMLTSEEYYGPFRTRLDESVAHTTLGTTWTENYRQTNLNPPAAPVMVDKTAVWTVEAVDELVNVPAGSFHCLRVRRDAGTAPKTFWFARGVGKVREEGGQSVLLVNFSIPPL